MPRPAWSSAPLLCIALLLTACDRAEEPQTVIRPVMVVQPQPAGEAVASYPGEVRARVEQALAFRVGGKVLKRLVGIGEHVTSDQPVAELDPQDLQLQQEAIRAQVAAAEANLQLVRAERDRYRALLEQKSISRSQYDNAENLYRAGEARLRQARAELNVAINQSAYAVLRAPQSGVIAQHSIEQGHVVAAGQPVFTLAADGERDVLINVPEQSFSLFRLEQPVTIELWSQPGQRFAGQVREISPAADAQSRTFAVRVAFSTDRQPAELGQSARVFIQAQAAASLSVPLSALTADSGQPYVWVIDPRENRAVRTPVRIGAYGEESVPVLEGLQADDWIVLAGVHLLQENQQVSPVDRNNRPLRLTVKE